MRHLPILAALCVLLTGGVVHAQGADECANAQSINLGAPGTVTVGIDNTAATKKEKVSKCEICFVVLRLYNMHFDKLYVTRVPHFIQIYLSMPIILVQDLV